MVIFSKIYLWRWLATLLIVIALWMPGTLATPLNGFPLSPYETLFIFIVLIIIWTSPWYSQYYMRNLFLVTIGSLVIWQFIGFILFPYGWSICLQRELERSSLTTRCEPSAESRVGDTSFIYPTIDFIGHSFPLYFMNETAFNYTNEEEPSRYTMPYTLIARAFFFPRKSTNLIITSNTPNTKVQLNGFEQKVPFDKELSLPLLGGRINNVQLSFTAENQSSNALAVATEVNPFYQPVGKYKSSIIPLFFYQAINWIILIALIALTLLEAIKQFLVLSVKSRQFTIYTAALCVIAWLSPAFTVQIFTITLLAIALMYILTHSNSTAAITFTLIFLITSSFVFVAKNQPPNQLILLEGGDDTLTHEDLARATLKAGSLYEYLEGGQSNIFYYQPLYRYVLGTWHKLLGESLWAPAYLQILLLSLAILYASVFINRIAGAIGLSIYAILTFLTLAVFENTPVKLAMTTYQEALALPVLIISVIFTLNAWIQKNYSPKVFLLMGIIWSFTISVRTNLTPALLAVFLFLLAAIIESRDRRSQLKLTLSALMGLAVFPSLVILRNIIVANKFAFFTSSLHPNLIDPLRSLFPGIGGASDLSFSQAFSTITHHYSGNILGLTQLLSHNFSTNYISTSLALQIAWILTGLASIFILFLKPIKDKVTILIAITSFLTPAILSSAFLHRSIAVRSLSNMLLSLILVIALALAFPIKKLTAEKKKPGMKKYQAR